MFHVISKNGAAMNHVIKRLKCNWQACNGLFHRMELHNLVTIIRHGTEDAKTEYRVYIFST